MLIYRRPYALIFGIVAFVLFVIAAVVLSIVLPIVITIHSDNTDNTVVLHGDG